MADLEDFYHKGKPRVRLTVSDDENQALWERVDKQEEKYS